MQKLKLHSFRQSKEEFEQDEQLRKALQGAFNSSSVNEIQLLEDRRNKEIQLLDNAINGTAKLSLTDGSANEAGPSTSPTPGVLAQPTAVELSKPRPKTPKSAAPDASTAKRRASAKPEHLAASSGGAKKPPMAAVKPPFKSQKSVGLF